MDSSHHAAHPIAELVSHGSTAQGDALLNVGPLPLAPEKTAGQCAQYPAWRSIATSFTSAPTLNSSVEKALENCFAARATSLAGTGGFYLPNDDFSMSYGAKLRGVLTERNSMHVQGSFLAADTFFFAKIETLQKTAIVAAQAEQPLTAGREYELFDEPLG